jgi:DNA primase
MRALAQGKIDNPLIAGIADFPANNKTEGMISHLIPEQVIEEIKARSELVAVVEQYVRLDKRSGANYFGLCPFHSEDTPSFSVSPAKQIYYCFGCHKGGDVIHFIMDIEKCAYPQAIEILAERANIKIPESDDDAYRQRSELNKQILAIMLEAARYYYLNLTGEAGQPGTQYLQQRGITPQTVRRFGLGYATEAWDGLYKHLLVKNIADTSLLLKSGLIRQGKNGACYDLFRHRLMFPIMDVMGRVVAFGGRVLDDNQPKYINSPETAIYIKGRHLYGLNLAKSSKQGNLVIVEGYMDAISMHQAGVDNTVASLGTALTESQAMLLRKYTEEVVVAYDSDAAGQSAALRSLDILGNRGVKVTVLQVPEGKDPDEYIRRNGPERFRALLGKALPLIDFKLLVARRQSSPGGELDILQYQDLACDVLAREENAIVRELYANKLAEELSATAEAVLREIERRHANPQSEPAKDQLRHRLAAAAKPAGESEQTTIGQTGGVTREELYVLAILAADPSVWERLASKPAISDFSEGPLRAVAAAALSQAAIGQLDTPKLVEIAGEYLVLGRPLHELIVRASMRLDDTFGRQDLMQAAESQLTRQRVNNMLSRKKTINEELVRTEDEQRKLVLKQELNQLTQQIRAVKEPESG